MVTSVLNEARVLPKRYGVITACVTAACAQGGRAKVAAHLACPNIQIPAFTTQRLLWTSYFCLPVWKRSSVCRQHSACALRRGAEPSASVPDDLRRMRADWGWRAGLREAAWPGPEHARKPGLPPPLHLPDVSPKASRCWRAVHRPSALESGDPKTWQWFWPGCMCGRRRRRRRRKRRAAAPPNPCSVAVWVGIQGRRRRCFHSLKAVCSQGGFAADQSSPVFLQWKGRWAEGEGFCQPPVRHGSLPPEEYTSALIYLFLTILPARLHTTWGGAGMISSLH